MPRRIGRFGWALVGLAALGCGRLGYTAVDLTGRDGRPGDPLDAAPDSRADVAADLAPDLAPDQPPDVAPDLTADIAMDLPPDAAPDLAPDSAPFTTPTLVGANAMSASVIGISYVHDAGREANRYLLIGVATETAAVRVVSVNYAGQALVRQVEHRAGVCGVALFSMHAPAAGANNARVDLDAPGNVVIVTANFAGVRQTVGQGDRWTTDGTGSPIELTVPSAQGELVVDMVCVNQATSMLVAASGQTLAGVRQGSRLAGGMSVRPGRPGAAMIWSFGGGPGSGWTSIAASLKPVP
jgi:hypothetical protein